MSGSSAGELCGIIPVFKPSGWTSFDVVAKLRGILHIRRLGHAGTLDPMATGVLPVFVGKATKACDILPDSDKAYEAGFTLGITTDTQDTSGRTLSVSENGRGIPRETVEAALGAFRGEIMQIPPMYSAVKVGGKKLYELAREGKEIEREPRPVTVYELGLTDYDGTSGEGKLFVSCSKGTYIRTVIHDLGQALGCGAAMSGLVRVRAAGFELDDCFTLEQLAELPPEQTVSPLIKAFEGMTRTRPLDGHRTRLYKNGVKLSSSQVGLGRSFDREFCVIGENGELLGIARIDSAEDEVRAVRNFY